MHIVVVPLKTAVGRVLTVIKLLPLKSPATAVHKLSLADTNVYVLVDVGVTVNV